MQPVVARKFSTGASRFAKNIGEGHDLPMSESPFQRDVRRYGIAVLSVAAATWLTHFLAGMGDSGLSPQFFAAVLLSAWYGGLGPGLVATLLSGAVTAYLLIMPHPRHDSSLAAWEDVLRVLVFTIVAVITSSL